MNDALAKALALATLNGCRVTFTPEHPREETAVCTGILWANPRVMLPGGVVIDTGAFDEDPQDPNRPADLQVMDPDIPAVIELDGGAGRKVIRQVVSIEDGVMEVQMDGWELELLELVDDWED